MRLRRGGSRHVTVGGFAPNEDDLDDDGPRDLSDRLLAMMARRQHCQQTLAMLAKDQEAFLNDMNAAFSELHRSSSAVEAPLGEEQSEASCSDAEQPKAASSSSEQPGAASSGMQRPETASTMAHALSDTYPSFSPRVSYLAVPPLRAASGDNLLVEGEASAETDRTRNGSDLLGSVESSWLRADFMAIRPVLSSLLRTSGVAHFGAKPSGALPGPRALAKAVLSCKAFEPLMGILILLNAANIGWTIEKELRHNDTVMQEVIEVIFLSIFMVELGLRVLAKGLRFFRCVWSVFDFLLISGACLVALLRATVLRPRRDASAAIVEVAEDMLLLRMLRLMRLVRAVRFARLSRPLWKLATGLMRCMGTMASAIALLFFAIYLFACFGVELIAKPYKEDAAVGALVGQHFSSLPVIMMTLFQFVSMDGAAAVYTPLVMRSTLLGVYFLMMVIVVTIALMNLIAAAAVDDAISMTQMDKEMKRHFTRGRLKEVRPAFAKLFRDIDTSGDGTVEIQDVKEAFENGTEIPREVQDMLNPGRLMDLFDLLDQDEDGALTKHEFVDGLSCMVLSDLPLETLHMLHILRSIRRGVMLTHAALGGSWTDEDMGSGGPVVSFKEYGKRRKRLISANPGGDFTPAIQVTPAASQQQAGTSAGVPPDTLWL